MINRSRQLWFFPAFSGNIGASGQVVTATFSDDVQNFVAADLTLTNLTVSDFATVDAATYTFLVTPVADGAVSVLIPAASLTDLNDTDNEASNTLTATADVTSPGVVTSGLPANISGPATFNATITFEESVTGFVAADIAISGGSITGFSGSGADYTASVSATGGADVVMSVAADVATDDVGNGNTASGVVTVVNTTATETSDLIAQFMQNRANALLSNQPDLADFLRGGGAPSIGLNANNDRGVFSYSSGTDGPLWFRLNANWATTATADSTNIHGIIGGHSTLSPNFLLGGMVQIDIVEETSGAATVSGQGWLVGPYFVAKLPNQPLYFEGSLLYGQTSNEVSPFGTYTDRFATERWLATLGVSGEIVLDKLTLIPFLDAAYTVDSQAEYSDVLGNTVAAQSISLGQISAGLDVEFALSENTDISAGISGIWSKSTSDAGVIPDFEGGRARVDFGLSHKFGANSQLAFSGYYDGIGLADYSGYGVEVAYSVSF
ncbi:MAG: hypothetical protein JKY31_12630 [Rhodobacteraceae bacterium]|nr:hypothetical protein [Paracoccaceae bacterium]